MRWIGLTGGIASGKSTVSRALKARGVPVVDADEIAQDVVKVGSSGLKSVVVQFGSDILNEDGTLNRQSLGRLVFGNPDKLKKLETILHPLIQAETQRRRKELELRGESLAIYDIPLLFETNAQDQFDLVVVVSCSEDQQKERLVRRNNLTMKEVEDRMAAQLPLRLKEQQADFVLHNDQDQSHLEEEIIRLMEWIKGSSKS